MTVQKNNPAMNNGLILIDEESLKTLLSETMSNALTEHLNNLKEPEDTLLTTKALCELLHTTPVQLWRWEQAGYFTSRKMGGKNFYSKKEVIEAMKKTRKYSEVQ